ncbi:polysaccharide biosynthesis/export family protein [Ruegeria arenilitoris]|uniref:polysaccharide biosynthesis/export family protein n=1 Tax=Ruegeria arenilitoris TaxID=1173585 RepID=UPI00147F1FED|nr:polysaccharide biosynthesis/export family protein [Ruegeria arenilitoris]
MKAVYALLVTLVLSVVLAAPAMAQSSYRIQPGDVLNIEVLEDESLEQEVLVRPDGRITMPLAGTLSVSGRSVEQVRNDLTNLLAPNFAAPPNVFVALGSVAEPTDPDPILVYAVGEAGEPGRYEVPPGTTLLQFFAEMGGFSRFAATKRIILRRADRSGNERVYKFNYDAILEGAGQGGATRLVDGDVIVVPQRRLFE